MEEVRSLMLQSCKLVKEFEQRVPNLANDPDILSSFSDDIDEIIASFVSVKQNMLPLTTPLVNQSTPVFLQQPQIGESVGVIEWLRRPSTSHQADSMNVVEMEPQSADQWDLLMADSMQMLRPAVLQQPFEIRGRRGEDSAPLRIASSERELSNVNPRQRRPRRSDDSEQWKRVPAPQFGNTDIPPEDGHTWRKYGQKEILGSHFPRSYYRCTHQRLFECPAKKQVQRVDDDPAMFGVLYRGTHTCTVPNTAPSPIPLIQPTDMIISTTRTRTTASELIHSIGPPAAQQLQLHASPLTSVSLGWLDDRGILEGRDPNSGAGAGPSTAATALAYGRADGNEYPMMVADIADTMFNSGSSSSNSMDFLFHSMDDKWDRGDKKV